MFLLLEILEKFVLRFKYEIYLLDPRVIDHVFSNNTPGNKSY
jgi:hypothetical protein